MTVISSPCSINVSQKGLDLVVDAIGCVGPMVNGISRRRLSIAHWSATYSCSELGGNRGRHVFDLIWTSAGVVLVLGHCRPHRGMMWCR